MSRSRSFLVGSQLVLLVAIGCYPVTRMNTPTVLEAGKMHVALAAATDGARSVVPDLAIRGSATDDLELGLRLRPAAIELGAKWQLTRGAVEVSVAPSVLHSRDADLDNAFDEWTSPTDAATVTAARGTVFVGSDSSNDFSLWIAPSVDGGERRLTNGYGSKDSYSEPFAALGLSVGMVVGAATAPVRMLVEVGGLLPFGGPRYAEGPDNDPVQTRLGPHDRRFGVNVGVLLPW